MTGTTQKQVDSQSRNLFEELLEGFDALEQERTAKRTLRTHPIEYVPPPDVSPEELIQLRKALNLSRAVFAAYLRTRVRTLENWEQGRARPNAQAALLISLVKKFPDTVQRLAQI
jgi:putative transcriptional regulator